MLQPFTSIFWLSLVVWGTLAVGFHSTVPNVSAAEGTITVERTPAFYQALRDIYDKLVTIQSLVEELILKEAAALDKLTITTSDGVITTVLVEVDYATKVSSAIVQYRDGTKRPLTVLGVVQKDIVVNLATQLGITTKQLTPLIKYSYKNGDALLKIVVTLKNSRTISITQVYADSTTKQQAVPPAEIDAVIADDFFGMTSVYQAFYDDYLAKVIKGEKPTEVVSFVATILKLQPETVASIIEFTY